MKRIALFSAKKYDKLFFDAANQALGGKAFALDYFDETISKSSIQRVTKQHVAVVPFVNDHIHAPELDYLVSQGVKIVSTRSAGFNHIDVKSALSRGVKVARVPEYSPNSVAEFAMALLLSLTRKVPRAIARTKELNFDLTGLCGHNIHNRTVGIIGLGKIGKCFASICKGFGANIICHDAFPSGGEYNFVSLDQLLAKSEIIALFCPLTPETKHIINTKNIAKMRDGVILVNVGRGGLVNAHDLIEANQAHKFGGIAMDVYENEAEYFFEDVGFDRMKDWQLVRLLGFQNTIVTSHMAFLVEQSMKVISATTLDNIMKLSLGEPCANVVNL